LTLFDHASVTETEAGRGPGDSRSPSTEVEAPAPASLVRLRLVVAYDGTSFRGFAAQSGQRTVAGELARAISTVAGHEVEIVCAGRTDAGVHAVGQVVHVDVRSDLEPERVAKAVNSMLSPCVVVRSAGEAEPGFDARRSARSRTYRYLVLCAGAPDPLLARSTWHVRDPLDLGTMSAASDSLLGEHDFAAFCRRPPGVPKDRPIVRRVLDARWSRSPSGSEHLGAGDELLRFEISARSFCHQMVRSIVGTLVDVGRGRRRVSDVTWLLQSGDRSGANTVAPPQGLCLMGVEYGPDR
jgi:tRNA pseudouridine38-40 synthase